MDETYGTYVDDEYFDNHDYDDDTDDDNDHKNDSYTKEKLRCCYWYFGKFFSWGETIKNIVFAAWICFIVSEAGFWNLEAGFRNLEPQNHPEAANPSRAELELDSSKQRENKCR